MERNWYNMQTTGGKATVNLFGEIGWEVNAAQFANDLKALGELEQIDLNINSGGGSIIEGTAIFNILLRHPARVVANVEGWAASMASVIAMAADEIVIPENAWMVIHNPWGGVAGEAEDLRKHADLLDRMKDTIVEAYMRHAKVPRAEIVRMMDEETWMNGPDAVEKGFATRTTEAIKAAASIREGFAKMPDAAKALFANTEPQAEETPADPPAPDAPAPTPEPEPEPAKPEDPPAEPAPDTEKDGLKEQNAALADALNQAKADLEAANAKLATTEAARANLENRIAAEALASNELRERLNKLTGGMGAPEDQGGINAGTRARWGALVEKHGYEEARKKFPDDFANFMANARR